MAVTPEQLAATLIARKRLELERARERAVAVRAKLDDAVARAAARRLFSRATLIGSLAWGTFGAGSDVDVVVEGLAPADIGELYGLLVDATGVEVDLLRFEELPATFQQRVRAEGIVLHGA